MDIKDISEEDIKDMLKLIPNNFIVDDEVIMELYNEIRFSKTMADFR